MRYLFIPIFCVLTGSVFAADIESIIPDIEKMASERVVVAAVKAQNAKKMTLAQIQALDKTWTETPETQSLPAIEASMNNPAAKLLAKLQKIKPFYIESLVSG